MPDTNCSLVHSYIDPNWPRPHDSGSACIIIYGYVPSFALGILGVILFTIALALHFWLQIRHRTWYFSTVLIGTVMEIAGYIFRILASKKNPYAVSYFVSQYFCLVVAPVFYSAAIFSLLSVMIDRVGPEATSLRPKLILWIFIAFDVVATLVQVTGASLVGSAYSSGKSPDPANHILLAGLAVQIAAFTIFLGCYITFIVSVRNDMAPQVNVFSIATLVAALAVYLRTTIRLAETAEGLLTFLSTHEVIFGCLEFAPIVVAVYLFIVFHPGKYLKSEQTNSKAERSHALTSTKHGSHASA